MGGTAIKLTV